MCEPANSIIMPGQGGATLCPGQFVEDGVGVEYLVRRHWRRLLNDSPSKTKIWDYQMNPQEKSVANRSFPGICLTPYLGMLERGEITMEEIRNRVSKSRKTSEKSSNSKPAGKP